MHELSIRNMLCVPIHQTTAMCVGRLPGINAPPVAVEEMSSSVTHAVCKCTATRLGGSMLQRSVMQSWSYSQ